jgi:dihydrofolate reductase
MKGSVFIAVTVDGYIATRDGDVDFLTGFQDDEESGSAFSDFMASVDAIVMGHNTFDKVVSFGEEIYPYGNTPLVVWTRTPDAVKIPDYCKDVVSCSSKTPTEIMDDLKAQGRTHVYVDGGTTVQSFIQTGMIQEMIITRVPVLLGEGISLFGKLDHAVKLKHIKTKTFRSGMVTTHYRLETQASNN